MRPVVIGAVLALCISVVPQQARADERTVLMNVGGDPPASLSSACISLIHSLPRLEGAPSQLDAIRMDNSQSEEDMKQYAIGLLLPIGIIILLALLTWGIWIGFCCDRWCYNRCDRCGGREATRQYTSKDQLYLKIGSIILLAASLVLFFIGLVSNAQISSSTDDTYVNSDKLVEHVFRLNAPLGDMRAATDDAYSALQSFNATLFAHLPSPELADAYVACVHTVYGQVQREGRMMLGYNPVTESGYPIISLMPQQIAEMETTVSNTLVDCRMKAPTCNYSTPFFQPISPTHYMKPVSCLPPTSLLDKCDFNEVWRMRPSSIRTLPRLLMRVMGQRTSCTVACNSM